MDDRNRQGLQLGGDGTGQHGFATDERRADVATNEDGGAKTVTHPGAKNNAFSADDADRELRLPQPSPYREGDVGSEHHSRYVH
jgi:uncharacterized protein (DUF608 family)